jgi:integrase
VEGQFFETSKARRYYFEDMVMRYLEDHEKLRDRYTLKRLGDYFNGLKLIDISTDIVADYKRKRDKVVRPATVYQELSLMRRMFNVARKEWKWVKESPVADLSFSVGDRNSRDRWLTVEEEQRLIGAATNPQWLRTLLIVALQTGMRRSEILNLSRQDVDFQRRTVFVRQSKNGQQRTIPMSDMLYDTLKAMKVRSIGGGLFPVSASSLRAAFSGAVAKAGIEDFHFHDLRHTFATRLIQNGADPYSVQLLLGHKSFAMTRRYAHHNIESLRRALGALNGCDKNVTLASEKALQRDV